MLCYLFMNNKKKRVICPICGEVKLHWVTIERGQQKMTCPICCCTATFTKNTPIEAVYTNGEEACAAKTPTDEDGNVQSQNNAFDVSIYDLNDVKAIYHDVFNVEVKNGFIYLQFYGGYMETKSKYVKSMFLHGKAGNTCLT